MSRKKNAERERKKLNIFFLCLQANHTLIHHVHSRILPGAKTLAESIRLYLGPSGVVFVCKVHFEQLCHDSPFFQTSLNELGHCNEIQRVTLKVWGNIVSKNLNLEIYI